MQTTKNLILNGDGHKEDPFQLTYRSNAALHGSDRLCLSAGDRLGCINMNSKAAIRMDHCHVIRCDDLWEYQREQMPFYVLAQTCLQLDVKAHMTQHNAEDWSFVQEGWGQGCQSISDTRLSCSLFFVLRDTTFGRQFSYLSVLCDVEIGNDHPSALISPNRVVLSTHKKTLLQWGGGSLCGVSHPRTLASIVCIHVLDFVR